MSRGRKPTEHERLGRMAFMAAKKGTGAAWPFLSVDVIEALVTREVMGIVTAQAKAEVSVEWIGLIWGVACDLVRSEVQR
jgi:hypothetical protein